jgi:predicted PurR-regulated permease PerM
MTSRLESARPALVLAAAVLLVLLWTLRDLAMLVGYAVLLAYALLPAVQAIGRLRIGRAGPVPRAIAAALVVLILVGLVGAALVLTLPRLALQASRFAAAMPPVAARLIESAHQWARARGLGPMLDPAIEGLRTSTANLIQNLGGLLVRGLGWLFGGLGEVLGLVLLPLLAFYLLADADAVRLSALGFLPAGAHATFVRLGAAVDRALRSYVRGQALVCLVMAIAVGAALQLLGFPLALLLGVLVGLAELIPFLGFAVAAIAVMVTGSTIDPLHALLGLAAYAAINWLIGTFVTPRVMGRYLRMHPFVVTVSVLAGGKLLGPGGALLALPGAAVIQSVIAELAGAQAEPAPTTSAPARDE